MSGLKRKTLSLEEKLAVIEGYETGRRKTDICKEFQLVSSTLYTILKNKEKIVKAYEDGCRGLKRIRRCERVDVDAALIKWFRQCRNANVPVNITLLMQKAEEFGASLGDKEFKCSRGWIDRFKQRYGIKFEKMNESVDSKEKENWLKNVWPKLRKGYTDDQIYCAKETGIFFRLLPDQMPKLRNDEQFAKDRISVLLCTNMTGTDKMKLLVVGAVKQSKDLPANYETNPKSWITSEIFERQLREWDQQFLEKQKKILLLLDSCPTHPILYGLTNIKLVLLPFKPTSTVQPMAQGIIKNLKCHYRKILLTQIIPNAKDGKQCNVTLDEGIECLNKAWHEVTSETITNSFCYAKLCDARSIVIAESNEDDIMLPVLMKKWKGVVNQNGESSSTDVTAELFASADEFVATSQQTNAEVKQEEEEQETNKQEEQDTTTEIKLEEIEEEQDTEEGEADVPPSVSEALKAVKVLISYYKSCDISDNTVEILHVIERDIERKFWSET